MALTDRTARRPGTILTRSLSASRPGDLFIVRWVKKGAGVGLRHQPEVAPSHGLLSWARSGELDDATWTTYRERYLDEMRDLWRRSPTVLEDLVRQAEGEGVALVCYCPSAEWEPDTTCHRIVLADDVLLPLAESMGVQLRSEHR